MEKAVVLLSGGMNSAVAAASLNDKYELYMLFVQFHQRPGLREQECYQQLCNHFQVRHHWKVEFSHFRQVGGNAFVDPKQRLPEALELTHDVAETFVPALLPTLFDAAAAFAYRLGAGHLVTGVSENLTEPSPGVAVMYPDHRREFLDNYQYMLASALPERRKVDLLSPLVDFSRTEIVKIGARLGVPFEHTWSCYDGGESACGKCFGCVSRAGGFLEAGIADPLLVSV